MSKRSEICNTATFVLLLGTYDIYYNLLTKFISESDRFQYFTAQQFINLLLYSSTKLVLKKY